jgi:hypothetical protein
MSDTPRTDDIARGNHVVPTEWAQELERENASLKSHMTEAWKLVNAMAGQEYWDRAEDWLAENRRFAPEGIVSND